MSATTGESIARDLAATRKELVSARARLADATAAAEQHEKAAHPYADDMATVSGIRRKPSARADQKRDAANRRRSDAWSRVRELQAYVSRLEAREAHLVKLDPQPWTGDQIKAATHVRDRYGWHQVVRVSAKSVTVRTPYSWTDRIARDRVLEVR